MSFDYEWQDTWWAQLSDEETKPVYSAAECMLQLRLMALDKQMKSLLIDIKNAESRKMDTSDIVQEYMEATQARHRLQTEKGKNEFIDSVLTRYYEGKKIQEESLPL